MQVYFQALRAQWKISSNEVLLKLSLRQRHLLSESICRRAQLSLKNLPNGMVKLTFRLLQGSTHSSQVVLAVAVSILKVMPLCSGLQQLIQQLLQVLRRLEHTHCVHLLLRHTTCLSTSLRDLVARERTEVWNLPSLSSRLTELLWG